MSDPRDARDTFDARLQRHERLVPPFEDDAGLEPPAELDQIVVARARRALRDDRAAETGPSRTWLPSWGVPVAIAATLVLSFALVLQMSGIEEMRREVAVLQPPAAAPAVPAEVPAAAPLANVAAASAEGATASTTADAAAAAPTPPEPAAFEARATRPAPMPRAAAKSRAEAIGADAAGASGTAATVTSIAPAPPAAPPPDVRDDPDRWLRDIAELRADGQLDAARRELAAFVARHPTHAVPPDLAGLLPR